MFEKCRNAHRRRVFRQTVPNFFEIHTVFRQKFVCVWRKTPLPLVIPPFIKQGLMETLQFLSDPEMKAKLLEGKETPLSECIPEEEAGW